MGEIYSTLIGLPPFRQVQEYFYPTPEQQLMKILKQCYKSIDVDELIDKVSIRPMTSPYRNRSRDDDEEEEEEEEKVEKTLIGCMDGHMDEDEETEEEEEEEDEEDEDELDLIQNMERQKTAKTCGQCERILTPTMSFVCPKCHSAVWCSLRCMKTGRSRHLEKCSKNVNFKTVETIIQCQHRSTESIYGRHFGFLKDVPGIEHEFLGGSKISLVLKVGRSVPHRGGCVFRCEDAEGQQVKVKFEDMRVEYIQTVSQNYGDLYVPIFGASFQDLPSSSGNMDSGIVKRRDGITFYNPCTHEGKKAANEISLLREQLHRPIEGKEVGMQYSVRTYVMDR